MSKATNKNDQQPEEHGSLIKSPVTKSPVKKGMLRPSGIGAVAVILGGGVTAGYLFTGDLIKWSLTKGLETGFGAEANIEDVIVDWHPFSVKIQKLQQTDPEQPKLNVFQFEQATASVNLYELILGKTVVDQMSVSGLSFSQPRKDIGEIYPESSGETTATEEPQENDDASSPESSFVDQVKVPDVDSVLAKSDLITEKKARQLKSTVDSEKSKLEQSFNALPNSEKLKEYDQQWKKLKSSKIKSLEDLKSIQQQVKAIQRNIKQDRVALKNAQQQYKSSRQSLDKAYTELKGAPDQDWNNIKEQYPVDNPNAIAISKLLLGDEITGYLSTAQSYWKKIKPYIEASKEVKEQDKVETESVFTGKTVTFPLDEVWPDWIVRNLDIEVLLGNPAKTYRLLGKEITTQSYVRDIPSEYSMTLTSNAESFRLNGKYYIDQNSRFATDGHWQIQQPNFKGGEVMSDGDVNISFTSAKLNGKGKYAYQEQLTSNHQLMFTQAKFDGNGGTKLADMTLNTLRRVDAFDIDVSVSGELTKPDIDIRSDLDKKLSKGFQEEVKQNWLAFRSKLKTKLQSKVKESLDLNDADLEKINKLKAELDSVNAALKGKDDADGNTLIAEVKKRYENEVKAKAKAKLNQKKKDEEERLKKKLKEKFKGLF